MTASKQSNGESKKVTEKKPITALRLQRIIGLVFALFLLVVVVFLSLMIGSKPLSIGTVWEALFSSPTNSYDYTIIHESRLPRTIIALAVGPAFGLAGAVIQALTRNPLADPGILGVNAGAAFAVALAVGVFSITSMSSYIWFALAGALITTIAIYFIGAGAGKKSPTPEQITLAGVALAAALNGITTALSLIDSRAFAGMLSWRVGSIARKGLEDLWTITPFLVVGAILAFIIAPALNAIAYGDDRASSLGVNVNLTRILGLISITLLAGGATAIAGPIVFLGLMVPHLVRWFIGPNQPWIFLYSVVLAPMILLLSDIIGRVVMSPAEVPVGIITGFVGAPILLILMRRRKVIGL
ncbi:FecCD family ABC transporter permease [Paenibacillus sp. GCM10028914]|uniref:FecCD family ABC transporter permease n=1 Tax=Paenibacillus sp. GCM10028914 TaxID=3273416 RepID=UPI00362201C7